MASAPEVDRLLTEVDATRPPLVVVDLRGLGFMDSSGLQVLVAAEARRRDAGVRLSVVPGAAQVSRLLALTCAERHLTLVDRVPDGSWAPPAPAGPGVAR